MATRSRYCRWILAALLLVIAGLGVGLYAAVVRVRHAAWQAGDT